MNCQILRKGFMATPRAASARSLPDPGREIGAGRHFTGARRNQRAGAFLLEGAGLGQRAKAVEIFRQEAGHHQAAIQRQVIRQHRRQLPHHRDAVRGDGIIPGGPRIQVIAKLQVAALRRARIKQANRTPFHLYVDEFQNFATMSFVQMLSEARKYKLFLTMAEQSTSQQDEQRLVDIILANVGTVICFRSGSPSDERYVLPLFFPYIEQGEIANLPSYNFYARIVAIKSQEPMSGSTVLLNSNGSEEIAERVLAASRDKNAKKPDENVTKLTQGLRLVDHENTKRSRRRAKKSQEGVVRTDPSPIK